MPVIHDAGELASLPPLAAMPYPNGVLLCTPDQFDIVDVKNDFMTGQVGQVDRTRAHEQWDGVQRAFLDAGMFVETIHAAPGLEDMVFCANQTFVGLDPKGLKIGIEGRMKHESRRREVPHFVRHLQRAGYQMRALTTPAKPFEGSGDLLWHPGRRCIWAGYGQRTSQHAFAEISDLFDAPVIALELADRRFYHLDTCLCLIDERTALLYPAGLTTAGRELVAQQFEVVIEVDAEEAGNAMACNATACLGQTIILQRGAPQTAAALRSHGFEVTEVDTGEFMKSGGSVFCLKQFLF
ncbi:MAG: arginine deiminase-related protein [Planctomycetota bacterium]